MHNRFLIRRFLSGLTIVSLALLLPLAAQADQFDDQIAALKQQMVQQKAQADSYSAQAADYQARVDQLNAQMAVLQTQINLNQLKFQQLTAQIAANEQKLAHQRDVLGATLKQMYLDSNQTELEVLVSSQSLSDFFDRQEYQDKVKQKIQDTMASVQQLQTQLNTERDQTTASLALQNQQSSQLAAAQAEADQLLAAASENVAAANAQVKQSNAQIASLKAQQAAILAANSSSGGSFGGSGGACDNGHGNGGYPSSWCNAPQDAPGYGGPWGYNRECVSWAGYRRNVIGRTVPAGWGNANTWDDNARAAGYRVDNNPEVGAIAQTDAGYFGHVAVVESISGGNVYVSEMNYDGDGHFRLGIYSASYFKYIH